MADPDVLKERIYRGMRLSGSCVVTVNHEKLPIRLDLRNHSPDGFEWGYGGSGPAQLALAILADVADDETAQQHYQLFKRDVIAGLSGNQWELGSYDVIAWLDRQTKGESADEPSHT